MFKLCYLSIIIVVCPNTGTVATTTPTGEPTHYCVCVVCSDEQLSIQYSRKLLILYLISKIDNHKVVVVAGAVENYNI